MRDALLLLFILAALAQAMRYPFTGLITWAWFTLMTPHQMAYGVFGVPLNFVIAAVTILAIAVSGAYQRFRLDTITLLMALFSGWLFVSQQFSLDADNSAVYFDRFIKVMLFVILCAQMTTSKLKLHAMIWMLVIGVGYFAAKGAVFTIATLGQHRVQGIPLTVLEDNNHMGIAIATVLPLILYLRSQAANLWVRRGMTVLFAMSVLSVFGTHSRGAFICLVVFGGYLWMRSRRKLSILAALSLLTIPAVAFMPAKWTDRMSTITEATQDESFMGRVDAWVINWKFAVENPVTGAGLRNPYQPDLAVKVDARRAESAKAAHSIYFETLGGAGFTGLALYLSIFAAAFLSSQRLVALRSAQTHPPWLCEFGYYAQISLVVFAVGGASTSMEMWDGYMLVIAMIAAAARMSQATYKAGAALRTPAPSWRLAARGAPQRPKKLAG